MNTTTRRVAALTATIITAAMLASCSSDDPESDAPVDADVTTPAAEDEATPAEDGDEVKGLTRDNPLDPDEAFSLGNWTLKFGPADTDVEAMLQEEADTYYDGDMSWVTPPEKGSTYVAVDISATYNGEDRMDPAIDLSVAYVSPEGTTHSDPAGTTPEKDFWSIGDLYTDATGEGTIVLTVPKSGVRAGVWRVSDMTSGDMYVALGKAAD